jgi:hypothetical protein
MIGQPVARGPSPDIVSQRVYPMLDVEFWSRRAGGQRLIEVNLG